MSGFFLFEFFDLLAEVGEFFFEFRVLRLLNRLGNFGRFGGFFGDERRCNGKAQRQHECDPKRRCAFDAFPIRPNRGDGMIGSQDADCGEGKAAARRKQGGVKKKFRRHFAQWAGSQAPQ